jgi:spore maturation protein SpmA
MDLFAILLPFYGVFCLWLGYRIIEKAGLDGRWVLVLLLPVVNIIMIWVFAFSRWPNLRREADQDL